jgi:glucose-6-phosphate isomerase
MALKFDYTNLLYSERITRGVPTARLMNQGDVCALAHEAIQTDRKKNILGFYEQPDADLSRILEFTRRAQDQFDHMVILGIGGSALGNRALYSALRVPKDLQKKLWIYDNVDPVYLRDILDSIEPERTLFNVITKSGSTAETMSAFLIVTEYLRARFPEDFRKRLVITTDAEKGFLRKIIREEGYPDFTVPDNVGGRFSVLTDVGLVSSAFAGIDIRELAAGAADMRTRCADPDYLRNPAYLNGLLHYLYMREGVNISVMMPYANELYDIADWYRQLWAESLGKRYDLNGREIHVGQTPVKALGATDQHSQVQLYVEGPHDKVVTFLTVEKFPFDYTIPTLYTEREEIAYLGGKTLGELLNNERLATEIALVEAGRPNCNIVFPELNEHALGEFIFLYEVQTVFTGKLLHINPIDQPGVEAGKNATYALMGKPGYEQRAREIREYIEHKRRQNRVLE